MRNRRRRPGVSTGTVATLVVLALVIGGSALIFPKLMGRVDQRVSPQQVGVALGQSFSAFSGSVLGQPTQKAAPAVTAQPTAPRPRRKRRRPGPCCG